MNIHDHRERLDYDPFEFEGEAREMAEKEANGPEYVSIYFELSSVDNDALFDETTALLSINDMLSPFIRGNGVDNEGHDCYDNLVCKFVVSNDCNTLIKLQQFIEQNHGGGDDIIYLSSNYTASNFAIVPYPGLSKPVEFGDWDEYIESL